MVSAMLAAAVAGAMLKTTPVTMLSLASEECALAAGEWQHPFQRRSGRPSSHARRRHQMYRLYEPHSKSSPRPLGQSCASPTSMHRVPHASCSRSTRRPTRPGCCLAELAGAAFVRTDSPFTRQFVAILPPPTHAGRFSSRGGSVAVPSMICGGCTRRSHRLRFRSIAPQVAALPPRQRVRHQARRTLATVQHGLSRWQNEIMQKLAAQPKEGGRSPCLVWPGVSPRRRG